MAFINLLHNGYQGKLGETVGQKWKNQRTVRTYNAHNNSKSEAQLEQREFYKEVITEASGYYATSQNLVLPPGTNMNKFNFITSLVSKIKDGTFDISNPGAFMGLKNGEILLPFGFTSGGKNYIYINDPSGEIKKSLNSFSIHFLLGMHSTKNTPFPITGLDPVAIYDKTLDATVNGVPAKKGFAIEIFPAGSRALLALGYLTIKKGKQRIFTKPAIITPVEDIPNSRWVNN